MSEAIGQGLAASGTSPWPQRLSVLDDLERRPLTEHAEVYRDLHSLLQAALADVDDA